MANEARTGCRSARSATAATRTSRPRHAARPPSRAARGVAALARAPAMRVRWDRVGRVGLLVVLRGRRRALRPAGAVAALDARAGRAAARDRAPARARERAALERSSDSLNDPATIERDARALGMVRPGERPYVVTGLLAEPLTRRRSPARRRVLSTVPLQFDERHRALAGGPAPARRRPTPRVRPALERVDRRGRRRAAPPPRRPVHDGRARAAVRRATGPTGASTSPRGSRPDNPEAWDLTTIAGAAFARYVREASDYGGGGRIASRGVTGRRRALRVDRWSALTLSGHSALDVVRVLAAGAPDHDLILLDRDLDRTVAGPVLGVDRIVLHGGVEPQAVALVAVVERRLERARTDRAATRPPRPPRRPRRRRDGRSSSSSDRSSSSSAASSSAASASAASSSAAISASSSARRSISSSKSTRCAGGFGLGRRARVPARA